MTDTQYRAQFDATVTFANGGGLRAEGFRIDVPHADVSEQEVAALFIASLSLLMVDRVELRSLQVLAEPHKGTHGGPSDRPTPVDTSSVRLVELSHIVADGTITYPGLPAPTIRPYLTRAQSRETYAPGTEFAIDSITMVGNTGTYLDSPFHRYSDGIDLARLPLESFVDLPGIVVRTVGSGNRAVEESTLAAVDVAGRAVLLHTGGDAAWGTPEYAVDAPFLTAAGARWLVDHGARLVGIDSINIDDAADTHRPAHSILLEANIPIVEHLTGLDQLPPTGFRLSAAPPRISGFGTFPVRAYAAIPE